MSDPKVTIQIEERGAAKTQEAVEKVAKAQEQNAKAAEQVAKSTEKAAKAAEGAAEAVNKQAAAIERLRAAESGRQAAVQRLAAAQASRRTATQQAAVETQQLAAAERQAAAATAEAAVTFGRQNAALGAVKAVAGGAAKALALVARAANILPALGLSGALVLIYKGFVALTRAITGSTAAAEGWVRISKAAARSTTDYANALKQLPQLSNDATIAQVRMSQAVERTTNRRADALAKVAAAQDELRLADADEKGAAAALRNAKSIDEMAAANARVRKAQKMRAEATAVLQFEQMRLTDAEEQHRKAVDDSRRAEIDRTLSVYRFRDSVVSLADSLSGGPGSLYSALYQVKQVGSKVVSDLQAGVNKEIKRRQGGGRAARGLSAARSRSNRDARDAAIDAQLAAMDLEYEGAEAQARGRSEGPPTNQMAEFFATVSGGAGEAMQAVAAYGQSLTEATMKAEAQRKSQVAMTEAITASAQSYASAALSALMYGGSVSEAINATAKAAFVEGTVGALGALAKAAVFSVINPPGVAPMLAAAKMYGAQAAVAGAIAAGTGGIGGGGGSGSTAITEPTPADFGEPERRERQDSEIFVNFASGQAGGRPISRADAGAILGALVDLARSGGYRLEAARA